MLINIGYLKNNFPNRLAETLNTIILRTDKHVTKAHKVLAIYPKCHKYFLYSLHGQFFDFHYLITLLKASTLVNSFCSKGTISQILGSN